MTTQALPLSLLLLVHLHILEFSYVNSSEYDHNVFNPHVRSLSERTKSMEDVCYFLVGKLERRAQLKQILPTYPCLQPSETVAFRTSLAKYLENLRNQIVRPATTGGKAKDNLDDERQPGWWWKDVIPSKSVLLECAGKKFEQLIVSLSTQAIVKILADRSHMTPEDATALARVQPFDYASLLASSQSKKRTWELSALSLHRQEQTLVEFRARLESDRPFISKHDTLSMERLLALRRTKVQDIARDGWHSDEAAAEEAVRSLLYAAGLSVSMPSTREGHNPANVIPASDPIPQPAPLPTTAAYYPSHLRSMRLPVLPAEPPSILGDLASNARSDTQMTQETEMETQHGVPVKGLAFLAEEQELTRMQRTLQEALEAARAAGCQTRTQLSEAMDMANAGKPGCGERSLEVLLTRGMQHVKFDTLPGPDMLSLPSRSDGLESIERRVKAIREHELPKFPPFSTTLALKQD